MNRYDGLCCPVCKAKLFEDDDIVVCPDCGAPHHRKCWEYVGHCALGDAHGTANQWQRPNPAPQNATDGESANSSGEQERRRIAIDDYDNSDGSDAEDARDKIIRLVKIIA